MKRHFAPVAVVTVLALTALSSSVSFVGAAPGLIAGKPFPKP